METIIHKQWEHAYTNSSDPAHQSLIGLFEQIWTKEWIVAIFVKDEHFTGQLVHYEVHNEDTAITVHGKISHLDSLLADGRKDTDFFTNFLDWTSRKCTAQITRTHWLIVQRPTGNMERLQTYLAPGQHSDLKSHIDCCL